MKQLTYSAILGLSLVTGLATPALGISISISPPPTLELDGMNIETGIFSVTSASAFTNIGGIQETVISGLPTSINAVIGESSKSNFLFDAPDNTQTLRITGNFNATTPDKPPAFFDIFIDGEGTNVIKPDDNWIYYLPEDTSTFAYQFTQLGTTPELDDNTDLFSGTLPTLVDDGDGGINVVGITPPTPLYQPQAHGTSQPVPEPTTILGTLMMLGFGTVVKKRKQDKFS